MQKLAAFAAFVLFSSLLHAQTPADLQNRLQAANLETSLDGPDLQPWHLKIEFDLFRDDGSVAERGSLEEWWAAADRYRLALTTPTYAVIETKVGRELFRSAGKARPPELLADLLQQVTQPLPAAFSVQHSRINLQKSRIGAVDLDCITLGNDPVRGLQTPLGLFPAYCFDDGSANLRISYSDGTRVVIRNHVTRFQNKAVAQDIAIKDHGVMVLRGRVVQLATYTPQAGDFASSPAQQITDDPIQVSAAEMAELGLRNTFPDYPRIALEDHRIGVVIVRALIGKDGRVHSATLLYSPDHRLTEASLNAVRQWTYRPFKLNGQVRDVETTLTFTFNLL